MGESKLWKVYLFLLLFLLKSILFMYAIGENPNSVQGKDESYFFVFFAQTLEHTYCFRDFCNYVVNMRFSS